MGTLRLEGKARQLPDVQVRVARRRTAAASAAAATTGNETAAAAGDAVATASGDGNENEEEGADRGEATLLARRIGGKETRPFAPFMYKMDHFTKTGSGQT